MNRSKDKLSWGNQAENQKWKRQAWISIMSFPPETAISLPEAAPTSGLQWKRQDLKPKYRR